MSGPLHPIEAARIGAFRRDRALMLQAAACAFRWEYFERHSVMCVPRATWNGWRAALRRFTGVQ